MDLATAGLSSKSSSEPLPEDNETEAGDLRKGFDLLCDDLGAPDAWSVDMLRTELLAGDLFVGERTFTPFIGERPALANLDEGNINFQQQFDTKRGK